MSTARQPLQNILWLLGERVARAAVTATVLGLVARHLQPEDFGRLNFAVTITLIAGYLANLGLEGIVVSELIRRPTQSGAVLGTACILRFVGGLGTLGVLALISRALTPIDGHLVLIVGLGLLIQPFEVVDLWFQRHLESRRAVVARTLGIIGGATVKVWLVATDAPLSAFAWAQVVDILLIAIAISAFLWRNPHSTGRWQWDTMIARELTRRGLGIAVSSLAVSLAMRLDQILVRQWLGEQSAGIYFAATRLTEVALFAGTTLSLSLFPALAASHEQSGPAFQHRLEALFGSLSALGWLAAIGCSTFGWLVVHVLYGSAYAAAIPVLAVLGWTTLVSLNASARWNYIVLAGPARLNLYAAGLHVLIVWLVGTALMPHLGPVGAAIALLLASIVSGIVTTWIFPALRICAGPQLRGLGIVFTPRRWADLLREIHH